MNKILVIEDEPEIALNIQDILKLNNFEVILTHNGQEGLFLAQTQYPNLILCDIIMPQMDGYEVLENLRKNPTTNDIPFIFLTGKKELKPDLRLGMELGADDYLTKPFQIKELIKAVTTQLEKKALIENKNQQKLAEICNNITRNLPHELNTPLSGILSTSQLLKNTKNTYPVETLHEMGEIIFNSAQRLENLLQKFWLYTELEIIVNNPEKRQKINQENLPCFSEQIIETIAKNLSVKYQRTADIQLQLTDGIIKIYPDKFSCVIEELLDNAFKFSSENTPVKVITTKQEKNLVIVIIDHGRGMTPEQIAKIGAYMQFERDKYEQQGSGMGLILAKKIVELYGGTFNLKSVIGQKTIVEITLPLIDT
jgi:signal transduction histidine kinase